tara:strand:+ start:154 stop:420 length:267 start_codon:yes stop_codon:yes gene_type:complete
MLTSPLTSQNFYHPPFLFSFSIFLQTLLSLTIYSFNYSIMLTTIIILSITLFIITTLYLLTAYQYGKLLTKLEENPPVYYLSTNSKTN